MGLIHLSALEHTKVFTMQAIYLSSICFFILLQFQEEEVHFFSLQCILKLEQWQLYRAAELVY